MFNLDTELGTGILTKVPKCAFKAHSDGHAGDRYGTLLLTMFWYDNFGLED